ncbi:MAG: carboxyl transferase domain-containing protein, partial [Acidimicrobiales bacterium]
MLTHPEFLAGPVDTGFVERHLPDWAVQADQVKSTTAEPTGRDGARDVGAPLTATVLSVLVEAGQAVSAGQPVAVLESMKMEHLVRAPRHGIVQSVTVAVSDTVAAGDPLLSLLPSDAAADSGGATAATTPATERREYADFVARRHRTTDEGRADAVARRHAAGRRTARQNVADLCDPGSFVEYGTFAIAAQRRRRELMDLIERTPGDGLVSGLARINGGQAAVVSYDYTVLAGTQGLRNHRKTDRLFELADRLRLPVVLFAEGGGGRPGDTDSGGFAGLDVPTFGTFARLSGQVPLVGVVSGYCFAGNAALLGCCDVIIATPDANIGMGGPAMIEGGGLGVHRPTDVGPVSVQVPNGVIDILAPDEPAAVATARRYLSYFQGPTRQWSAAGQEALRTVVPENRRRVYDTRDAITLIADEGSVLELRPDFGVGMVTALA